LASAEFSGCWVSIFLQNEDSMNLMEPKMIESNELTIYLYSDVPVILGSIVVGSNGGLETGVVVGAPVTEDLLKREIIDRS
jgi:hypothetical protein